MAEEVLQELGVAAERILRVFNKSDLLGEIVRRRGDGLWISAATGDGVKQLKAEVGRRLEALREPAPAAELPAPRKASV